LALIFPFRSAQPSRILWAVLSPARVAPAGEGAACQPDALVCLPQRCAPPCWAWPRWGYPRISPCPMRRDR